MEFTNSNIENRMRSRSNSGATKLRRQVTNQMNLVGNPLADNKIRETNSINNVHPGEEGYIPLSNDVVVNFIDNPHIREERYVHEEERNPSNNVIVGHEWDDDLFELWNIIKKQQAQISIMKLEIERLKKQFPKSEMSV